MRIRITPTQVFLDGKERFKPGRVYEVAQERSKYFIKHGWARDVQKGDYHWYRKVIQSG